MISSLTTDLEYWATSVIPGANVSFELPPEAAPSGSSPEGEVTVSFLLRHLTPVPQRFTRTAAHQVRRIGARFLVTAWSGNTLAAADALARLAVSAPDDVGFELELTPPDPAVWTALGVAPRPSLSLTAVASEQRPLPKQRLVGRIEIEAVPLESIRGLVRAAGGTPIPGATVRLDDVARSTRTDVRGEFFFSGVPAGPSARAMRVTAKGRSFEFVGGETVDASGRWLVELPDPAEWEA